MGMVCLHLSTSQSVGSTLRLPAFCYFSDSLLILTHISAVVNRKMKKRKNFQGDHMQNLHECAYLREIVSEAKFELSALYEHGLFNAGQFCENLEKAGDKLNEAGLDFGGEKFRELSGIINLSKLEPDWRGGQAVSVIAQIWRYLEACGDRLDYHEVLGEMLGTE